MRLALILLAIFSVGLGFCPRASAVNLQTFRPSPTAIMLAGSYDSKCVNNPDVKTIPLHIFTNRIVKLTLSLQGITTPSGVVQGRVSCNYLAYMRGGSDNDFVWSEPFNGPGMTFYNGYWHPSPVGPGQEVNFLDQATLTPAPKTELIFYHFACGADGCASNLWITYFHDHYPYADVRLLSLRDNGLMTYSVQHGAITIHGCMSPPGEARLASLCEIQRTVSLAFDTSAHQMAIQSPDPSSEAFFSYLSTPED